jgi:hypothetical protein
MTANQQTADGEAIPGVDPQADENLLRQSLGA